MSDFDRSGKLLRIGGYTEGASDELRDQNDYGIVRHRGKNQAFGDSHYL